MSSWKPALLKISPFGDEYDQDIIVESRTGGEKRRAYDSSPLEVENILEMLKSVPGIG